MKAEERAKTIIDKMERDYMMVFMENENLEPIERHDWFLRITYEIQCAEKAAAAAQE